MDTSFKVIAIISAFNEADIISPVIGHLVENGIHVYLIDNYSTDDTVQQAAQWLGKGLLRIETFPECREQASKFEWAAILRRKEELATSLQANWFIHHDADEIRESPWPGLNLKEAIQWVDRLGYNCIDFHVLNFPPTDDGFRLGDDPRTYFKFCEEAAEFDTVRRNAWKVTGTRVSLAAAGGHEARFPNRRLFPIKFLMRHYPIRGQQHGLKKIFRERTSRYLDSERAEGWHRQYDDVLEQSHSFLKDPASLAAFDLDRARVELIGPNQLVHNFTVVQEERDELRRHATNLEIDRREVKQHALNLERERDELQRHATNLEIDRREVKQHALNLERERDESRRYSASVLKQVEELREHASSLEVRLRQSIDQLKALENELHRTKLHAESLHELNQQLGERKSSLERELAAINSSVVWRTANVMRRLLIGKKTLEGAVQEVLPREPSRIFSSLDVPDENLTTVSESCLLRGWTCSSEGIESVAVLIDGKQVCQFLPEIERPDVALVLPAIPGSDRSGFEITVRLDSITPGKHDLEMVIRNGAGSEWRHHRSLLVDGDPYHRLLLAMQLSGHERRALLQSVTAFGRAPRFELWIDGRANDDMRLTLKSIAAQTYQSYTCHIVADITNGIGGIAPELLPEQVQWHRSFDVFAVDDGAAGDYLAFLSPGECLLPDALLHLADRLAKEPACLAYSDHDVVESTGVHADPDFVPDWSPEHLLSRNYVGGIYFARRDEVQRHVLDAKNVAWRFELLLRVTETAQRIVHIPRVLWSAPKTLTSSSLAAAEAQAVEAALMRRGTDAEVTAQPHPPVRRIRRTITTAPSVSIIVPTTGRLSVVRPMVESLLSTTSYANYELLFLDNGRGKHRDGIEFLRSKSLRVIERNEVFNWARLNNAGAGACAGELLLFLNDDIEVREPGWLEELVALTLLPDVGTVGALLLYPDGQIQHAGVFLVDHGGGSRHYLQRLHPNGDNYQHLDCVTREVTANTGACLMVRRSLFDEVGGFDEEFHVAFNDIDFCMRLAERGQRNLWTPHSRLIHHESLSRKGTDITEDELRLWSRWQARLVAGDAYHNPNLAKDRSDCTIDISMLDRKPPPRQEACEEQGVNLIGYIRAEMGLGEAARGLARAMEATGIPFVAIDYEYGNPARKADSTWSHRIVKQPVHRINILNVNADLTPEACRRLGSGVFEGRYTVGYWVWELPEFPDRWLSSFDHVDEVWVPSEFVREAVAPKARIPVIRIPYTVEKGPGPFLERPYFQLPDLRFSFLSMYDSHSVMDRKNPEGAITAFRNAFSPGDRDVGLILKINNFDEEEGEKLRMLIGDHKNIYVIDRTLTRYEVDSLLACCDCFVSLHRSEGFGLPMAEAMALGRPVIATYWSGNVDFMDETCAGCVECDFRQVGINRGPYDAHQCWAEPSVESAARWMRKFYSDPVLARRLGAAGKKKIQEEFSDKAVGDLVRARLAQIVTRSCVGG